MMNSSGFHPAVALTCGIRMHPHFAPHEQVRFEHEGCRMMNSTRWKSIAQFRKIFVAAALLLLAAKSTMSQATSRKTAAEYHNPILFADYSDPDVIRDGANYYLIASTFHFVPAIPILQSTDLVHWTIIAHVVNRLEMDPRYNMVGGNRYGGGVWAPAIRKHNGRFYVYFPTPNEGIFIEYSPRDHRPVERSGCGDPSGWP